MILYLLICWLFPPPLKLIEIFEPPKLNILLWLLLFNLTFLLLLLVYITLFIPFWMLQTFWLFCFTSILLFEPLKTTLDKKHFLCVAFILLEEPFIIKFKISFWKIILLLLPEMVKELMAPLIIKVELFLSKEKYWC